jgi:outer membrane protein TolC
MNDASPNAMTGAPTRNRADLALPWAAACLLLVAGCTAAQHRKSTDKETYKIVQQVESQVFGRTNAFTIDTRYSARKPEEITPEELIGDRLQTNWRVLTIEGALDLAVKNSREYQTAKEALYTTALNLSLARYEVGRSISPFAGASAVSARASDGAKSSSVTLGDPNHPDNANGVRIQQLFKTGGRLTVELLNSIMLYYTGKPEVSFSRVSASLVQPLLRGFGRNNPEVELLVQAERNMVYAVRDFSLYQDEFALGIVNGYFRLLQQKDTIRNRYTNYLGRVQSTKRLEARAADRERISDVDQARQAELTSKNSYVDAVASYRTQLDQFKITLGLPLGETFYLDDQALDELEQTGLVPAPLETEMAYRLAVQRQLQILNYIDEFEDSKRAVRIAADRLKPGLQLTGSAALETEGTDYTRFDPKKYSAGVGLELDLPLDRLPRGNAFRDALVTFESEVRRFTARLDDLKNDIESGVRSLAQLRQNYQIQRNALELANRRVISSSLRMQAGVAEVRDLVEAQDAQINAQNAVTRALVDYQTARLRLMYDIGALSTDQSKFWLKDHLAAFLPEGARPAPEAPQTSDQAVLPPDQYFNK